MAELLTTKELCERIKVSSITVYRWRKKGLPYIPAGKQIRYDINKVLEWLQENK